MVDRKPGRNKKIAKEVKLRSSGDLERAELIQSDLWTRKEDTYNPETLGEWVK